MASYDRADWHYGGDFPKDLAPENGGTHIGMFLSWAANNNLIGEFHIENSAVSLRRLLNKEITGREFLFNECDEKFWEEDLNEEGNAFVKYYYKSNVYFKDYGQIFQNYPTLYHVEDNWDNYNKIAKVITTQYKKWKSINEKKWWQFWK